MYDAEVETILDEDDEFAPKGKYQYIDASCTLRGDVIQFERGELDEDKIKSWATQKAPYGGKDGEPLNHLKVLCFDVVDPEDGAVTTLPCSKRAYEAIKSAWKLPDWTLKFLDNRAGNGLVLPYGAMTASKHLKRFGMATKNTNSHQMFVFYDPEQRQTNVLIRNNPENEFSMEELLDRLEKTQEFTYYPTLAPLLLVEGQTNQANEIHSGQQNRMERVQKKEAFFAWDSDESEGDSEDNEEGNEREDEDEDLLDLTREFTKLYTLMRSLEESLEDTIKSVLLVQTMHQMFFESLEPGQQEQAAAEWHMMFERLLFAEVQARKVLEYSKDNQREIQASIQTIYAFIGTNDSHLNYESAQASVKIAEDSRRVAILARQDSTDMRVIAGTTLLFLPATFVATLFSTNFFNFQPSTGLVSSWIWLYFAVSAALTVPVMLAWRLLSRARAKETAQILRVKDHSDDEQEALAEKTNSFGSSMASGNSLLDIKNRLSKRKKTPTMEMEEK